MTDKLLPQQPVNQDRGSEMRILQSSTTSSKYGRFWLRQNQDDGYNAKLEANGDVLVAGSTSFIKSMLANLQSTSSILCTARSWFPVERSLCAPMRLCEPHLYATLNFHVLQLKFNLVNFRFEAVEKNLVLMEVNLPYFGQRGFNGGERWFNTTHSQNDCRKYNLNDQIMV